MPYRTAPIREKPWWENMMGVYLGMSFVVGITGLVWPSASITGTIGAGSVLYSGAMLACGVAGVAAWVKGWRTGEAVVLWLLVGLTAVHMGAVVHMSGADGLQTAVRMVQAVTGILVIIGMRRAFGLSRQQMETALPHTEVLVNEVEALHRTIIGDDGEGDPRG